nr:MAG TPA: hypothetical protein [Caudoviricetes sp.]DAQ56663.1 MAG TPA: hypothetical protein [Caudoviricetes sp.]
MSCCFPFNCDNMIYTKNLPISYFLVFCYFN